MLAGRAGPESCATGWRHATGCGGFPVRRLGAATTANARKTRRADNDERRLPREVLSRQAGIATKTRFRHYLNLSRMETRLGNLLDDFRWGRMDEVFGV